jgi:D-alanyl-D-alanine carboxypeptidase/D-alanyl-D-alanine-endopeptidase (penicillin-binding protein 4)
MRNGVRRSHAALGALLVIGVVAATALTSSAADTSPSPLAALSPTSPRPSTAAVAAALDEPLGDYALGGAVVGEVLDAQTGTALWQASPERAVSPASTTKLLTAAAALTVLGPNDRPVTSLLATGPISAGVLHGDLVLRGGGDVLLASTPTGAWPTRAGVDQLAAQLRARGVTSVSGRLVADGSAFSGPQLAVGWSESYITQGSIAPVSGLGIDEAGEAIGRGNRSADPARAAASTLRAALARAGIAVAGDTITGTAPAGARDVARVAGPTVEVSVEEMLQNSDNDAAEALGRRVAIRAHLPATFAGAAQAVTSAVGTLGVPTGGLELYDTSGLSRDDRVEPATLAALLHLAAASVGGRPALRPLVTGLAVAAFDGTIEQRYVTGPALAGAGVVHAKTGALTGVTSLAGSVVDSHGRELLFVFVANGTRSRSGAEAAVDRAAAALAQL